MWITLEPKQLEHGVERAALALVADLDALDVEWDRTDIVRDVLYLTGIDIVDARLRIDEAPDQPGARDAVDLWTPPRHPQARRLRREALQRDFGDDWQASFTPGLAAALQHLRLRTALAQLRRDHLAEIVTIAAGEHDGPLGGQGVDPFHVGFRLMPLRGGNDSRTRLVDLAAAHIENHRSVGGADARPQLLR